MKPTHMDNPNHLPSGIADTKGQLNSLSEEKTNRLEASLRTYKSAKSAAVIGLAISLGASGVLLPHQGDEAIALEPSTLSPATANPSGVRINRAPADTNQALATQKLGATSPNPEVVEPSTPIVITASPSAIYHQVQSGDNFWLLSQKYQVPTEAIAQANNISVKDTLVVGQSLRIPTANAIHEMQLSEISETTSATTAVAKTQPQPIATSATQGLTNPELNLQTRQNAALQNLRGQRAQLRETLGGWQAPITNTTTTSNQNNWVASTATSSTPTSGWSNSTQNLQSQDRSALANQTLATPIPTQASASVNNLLPSGERATSQLPASVAANGQEAIALVPESTSGVLGTTAINGGNLNTGRQVTTSPATPLQPVVITSSSLSSAGTANWVNNSPRASTPNNWVASNPAPVSTPFSSVVAVITNPPTLPTSIGQEVAASAPEVHQVKAGETLDAIARRYGISRQELVRANGIANPNLLFVDQRLTIPASSTRVPSPASTTPLNNAQKPGSNYDVSIVTPPTSAIVAALPQPTSGGFFGGATGSGVAPVTNQSAQDELVIERLRADIRRMRDEYQQQPVSPVFTNQVSTPLAAAESRPIFASNPGRAESVNPEFRNSQSNGGNTASSVPAQPQLLAVAPSPTGTYNPMLQLPIGQLVSPELPPLAPADSYLPGAPARFNGYTWPAEGVLTSGYGMRWGRMHRGIDIAAPIGTPVVAAAPGVIITAGWNDGGFGNLVEVEHPDGSVTLYAHNDRILVKEGQKVSQGEQIAEMGTTGFSTGSHTHFEIHPKGAGAVDPIALMPRE